MGAAPEVNAAVVPASRWLIARRVVGIGLGALAVAAAAQVAVPVPLSPVPMTLQPLAVLAVGGLLGAGGGIAALMTYLALGIMGFPVFAGGASGAAHLIGPTGGYLLAFPVAAGLTGALAGNRGNVARVLGACALGMVVIHVGGVAQLAVLGGDPSTAFRVGFVPFLTGDLIKVGLAAAVIVVVRPMARRAH
jgi:biotin transport system substrate-specific component